MTAYARSTGDLALAGLFVLIAVAAAVLIWRNRKDV